MTLDISRGYSAETGVQSTGYSTHQTRNVRHFPDRRTFTNWILNSVPRVVLDKLSPYMRSVYLRCGDHLYQPEDPVDYIYFPETAVFSEYQMLDDGRTIEIAMMGRESVIGAAAVFGPCTAVNWVQVCVAGTAFKIESELFRKIAGIDSPVKALLNEHINSYIRSISCKVICNTHHSVEERFCTWLLMLSDRSGAGLLKLTQEQIARVLGVYRPSVTCIARDLKMRGLIDYVRGKITISDREKLEEAACGCYGEFGTQASKARDGKFSKKVSDNVI